MSRDWALLRLGDFFSELPKSTLPASCAEANGAYAFYCSSSEPKAADTWLQEQPAILMGTGGVASVHLGKGKYAYSTDTWAIRIKESTKLNQPYAYRVLELSLPKIDYAGFEGSGLRHLRKSYIKDFRFLAPSDSTPQKRIVSILDGIDTAIEKTEALIAKYQQIKAGLMHDLFTRGVLPNGQLRPPREQAPELYQETAIGWIPKGWEVVRMITLAEDRNGSTTIGPFGSDLVATDYRQEGVPVVFVRDIKESGFQWNSETYVSERKSQELNAHSVKAGEVLATKMGLPPCISCVYPDWMPNGVITADMIRLSPEKRKVDPDWLATAINQDRVIRQVAAITAGVTRPKVTLADFRAIKIAKPELDEQQRISFRLNRIQDQINIELARISKLQNQKLGLMHDLLTGKVPVKVKEPEAVDG
ncbi:MAG: restriction endonuclease subunit S [Burkholderiales bacterium]